MLENASILIVDDDNREALELKNFLKSKVGVDKVECTPSVMEACEYLKAQETDLVVLDLIMPMHDGYKFMELLDHMGLEKSPEVIVTSAISNQDAIKKAMNMGACYYMLKPYENDVLYSRIEEILTEDIPHEEVSSAKKDAGTDRQIMEIFLSLGLPPHLKGYQYLREAVKLALADPSIIYSITKRLYPEIAKRFDVTPTKVELAIRHALEVAWQRNRMDNLKSVFGCDIYLKDMKPTNGEFVALMADKLSTGY